MLKQSLRVVAALVMIGCSGPRAESDGALEERIAEEVAKGPGTVVDLGALAEGEWNRLQVLGPYTPRGVVDSLLGFEWADGRHERIEMTDDVNLLVFVGQGRVVRYVAYPRSRGDFCCADPAGGYERRAARFVVVADSTSTGGKPWYRLRQVDAPPVVRQ